MPDDSGVIYVATGASYRKDAELSAQSLKLIHPDVRICLFSDAASGSGVFDVFVKVETPHARSKISCMGMSPFRHTLFLDCDTRVVGPVLEPFALLERFDFAICLGKNRHPDKMAVKGYVTDDVPAAYYPYNSGVMYYRRSEATAQVFKDWAEAYHLTGSKLDQIPLRALLWKRPDISVYNLPGEFNARELSLILATNDGLQLNRILHLPLFNTRWGKWRRIRKTLQKFQGPLRLTRRLFDVFSR